MYSWELKDNYIALMMCIFTGWTPEQCFDYLLGRSRRKLNITKDDVFTMIEMKKKGMTYKEIGKIYGLSADATYKRIKRYKKISRREINMVGINENSIRSRFKIGQWVQIKQKGDGRSYTQSMKGYVVGIYEHFILVRIGKYKESFAYTDMAIGLIEVRVVKAA